LATTEGISMFHNFPIVGKILPSALSFRTVSFCFLIAGGMETSRISNSCAKDWVDKPKKKKPRIIIILISKYFN
jgi:hypothetical protein